MAINKLTQNYLILLNEGLKITDWCELICTHICANLASLSKSYIALLTYLLCLTCKADFLLPTRLNLLEEGLFELVLFLDLVSGELMSSLLRNLLFFDCIYLKS